MAGSNDSGASWADIVKTLLDTFQLLRDVFGYALPGLVFAGIGVATGRIQLQQIHDFFKPYDPPIWVLVALGIAACYVIGHLLACIAYLRIDIWKAYHRRDTKLLEEHPTEVDPEDLYLRHYYPDLFQDLERRETMSVLMYSTLAAMVVGWLVFCYLHLTFGRTIILASAFVFVDSLTTMSHLRRARQAIHTAGEKIKATDAHAHPHAGADDARATVGDALQAAADAVKKPPAAK
jgi:FtsH-binding integral membrane protein